MSTSFATEISTVLNFQEYLITQPPLVFTIVGGAVDEGGDRVYALYGPGGRLAYTGDHNIMGPMITEGVNPEVAKYGMRFIYRSVNTRWFEVVGDFPENMKDVVWA